MEVSEHPEAQQLHDEKTGNRTTAANSGEDEGKSSTIHAEEHEAIRGDESDGRVEWSALQILATLSLCALYAGSQLPLLFGSGSVSFMVEDIGGSTISTWVPVSYSLAFASINPFGGYLQDVFGRRNISITGGLLLCIGLIVVATSHGIAQAIVGMTICGCGAGIGELTALAGISEIVPVKQRGFYLGAVTASILPFAPYPIYTTELGTHATWRWCFWIPLIWNALAVVGIALTYWPHSQLRKKRKSAREVLPLIDYVGAFLSTGGLTMFLVAVTAGGYTAPWKSARVLCPLIIGILLIVVFVLWEWKFAKLPMVPRELFAGQRVVGMSFLISFIAGIYFYAILNFTPILYLDIYNPGPIKAGGKGVIIILGVFAGAVFPNMLISTFKSRTREILLFCAICATAFGTAIVTATPANPVQTIALCTLAGFGVGSLVACAVTTSVIATPDNLISTTVALCLSIRTVGGSVGTAINSNVFGTKLAKRLPQDVAKYAVKAGLPASSAKTFVELFLTGPNNITQARVPGVNAEVLLAAEHGSRWAYAWSLKYVWYTMMPFGVLSCLACLALGNVGKFMTNRVAANIGRGKTSTTH